MIFNDFLMIFEVIFISSTVFSVRSISTRLILSIIHFHIAFIADARCTVDLSVPTC
jgi:hypothetical protein